jgi:hypothetical protein
MQVLCMSSETHADIACPVCGQKYALYHERRSEAERREAMDDVRRTLVNHHVFVSTASAHTQKLFHVPEWTGPASMSAAALLGYLYDSD